MSQNVSSTYARRQSNWNRNQNITRFSPSVKLGPVTHTVLVALMITVLGLIYLTQATRATGYDYRAQEIESQIAELTDEKTDLEVENARLTALEAVRSSTVAQAMSSPADTAYVQE